MVRSKIRARSLGECPENGEHHATRGSGGVDALGQGPETHSPNARVVTVVNRWVSDRPSRSSFQTTRVSPGSKCSSRRVSSGRLVTAPLAWSVNVRAQPARCSASSCKAGSWPTVETRAYPRRCPITVVHVRNPRQRLADTLTFGHGFRTVPTRRVVHQARRCPQRVFGPAVRAGLVRSHTAYFLNANFSTGECFSLAAIGGEPTMHLPGGTRSPRR